MPRVVIGNPANGVWIKASNDHPGLFYLRENRNSQRRIQVYADGSSGYHEADFLRRYCAERGYRIDRDDSRR